MSSPSNQETLRGLDKAEYLGMSIRTQLAIVSPVLTEIYGVLPVANEGDVAPLFDWNQAQINNANLVDHGIEDVQEASKAHRVAKLQVSEMSGDRRDQSAVLRSHHRSLQQILRGSCGPKSLELVGLHVPPAESMLGVREQYGFINQQMKSPSLPAKLSKLAESVVGGSVPDLGALSADMDREILAFEVAQARWTQAKKVSDAAYAAKLAARRRLRRIVVNVARMQEGCYRLAGFDDLADRMRLTVPNLKSKKQPAAEPTGGSEPVPDPDASPVPDGSPNPDGSPDPVIEDPIALL